MAPAADIGAATIGGQAIAAYCKQAGIETPKPRADGAYVFYFDGKFEVQITPQGRDRLLVRSNLAALKRDGSRPEAVAKLLRVNLALTSHKHATLSIDNGGDTPFLYEVVAVDAADMPRSFKSIVGFVNDVELFQKALETAR